MGIALTRGEDGDSPRPGLDVLEQAPAHAERLAHALAEFTYRPYQRDAAEPPERERLVESALVSGDIDVLIVHVVGHGELAEGSSEKLYVLDADGQRMSRPVGAWIDLIEDQPQHHRPMTLFVLDVCYAGSAAVTDWHARMKVTRRRAWVLAATGPGQRAFGYRLSRALVQVLETYRSMKVRFDPTVPYIPVQTVWRDTERVVDELTARTGGLPQEILTSLIPGHADLSHLPFFPNPSFEPDRGTSALTSSLPPEIARLIDWAADPLHFIQRAGGAEPVRRDWREGYFTGRTEQLRTLSSWLDDTEAGPGLRVVVGKPGAGKSALLGVLVCAAHPFLRLHTRHLWAGLGDCAPGTNDRLAVIHARRLGLDDVVDSLARQLRGISDLDGTPADHESGVQAGSTPADHESGVRARSNPAGHLLRLLPPGSRPVTVIVDALDEALRPQDITTALLLPLARQALDPDGRPRLRLLIGTRDDGRAQGLLDLAAEADACMDLGAVAPATVRQDLDAYVKRLLAADGPYAAGSQRPVRDALARAMADALTGHDLGGRTVPAEGLRWGEFLNAGLYTHFLLAGPLPGSPREAAALGGAIPLSLPSLLELDLRRHSGRPLLRPVLTALAHAQGRGMPEGVLAHVAAAFLGPADRTAALPLPYLYALLDEEARFYLRREVDEDGTTLYRLFHEGLAERLRALDGLPLEPPSANAAADDGARRVYERLLNCVPRDAAGRRQWQHSAPYLLRHTAQHAVDAGRLDELLEDVGFLQHADPVSLADALRHAASVQARTTAAVYRASWGIHHELPPPERRKLLALDAARFRDASLRRALPGDEEWRVLWATGDQVSPALVRTLTGHRSSVLAVATVELDGRPHAVTVDSSGDEDYRGSLRIWDLTTGSQTRELTGPHGAVGLVEVAQLDGRPHAVISDSVALQIRDLKSGGETHRIPLSHRHRVQAVAVVEQEGRPHLVTGGADGAVKVWDLATGTPTRSLRGHGRDVRALAVVDVHGEPQVVTGDADGHVRLASLAAGSDRPWQLAELIASVSSVVAVHLDGVPHAITVAAGDGMGPVRLWNLVTRTEVRVAHWHTRRLALTEVDGRPLAVTGSWNGAVRVWDVTTGALTRVLTGHTSDVSAMAVTDVDGRPHAVTGARDGEVRVWDLTSSPRPDELTVETSVAAVVAVGLLDGRRHALAAGGHGSIRLWDLTAGTLTRALDTDGTPLTVAAVDGRLHAVVSGRYHDIGIWDVTTGTRVYAFTGPTEVPDAVGAPHMDTAALTTLNDRPHLVMGGRWGPVQVWDCGEGTRIHELTRWGGAQAIAIAEVHGQPHAIVAAAESDARWVRVWNVATGRQTHELINDTTYVRAVAAVELNGRPHAITANSLSGLVQIWDLTTGTPSGVLTEAGYAAEDAVSAMAVVLLDSRPHCVTGGPDGSVRVWDLTTLTRISTFRFPTAISAITMTSDATVVVGFGPEVAVLRLTLQKAVHP
ncbi:hypothetical protein ACWCPM_20915 [Streptomyces sp. NPDC002309]